MNLRILYSSMSRVASLGIASISRVYFVSSCLRRRVNISSITFIVSYALRFSESPSASSRANASTPASSSPPNSTSAMASNRSLGIARSWYSKQRTQRARSSFNFFTLLRSIFARSHAGTRRARASANVRARSNNQKRLPRGAGSFSSPSSAGASRAASREDEGTDSSSSRRARACHDADMAR